MKNGNKTKKFKISDTKILKKIFYDVKLKTKIINAITINKKK